MTSALNFGHFWKREIFTNHSLTGKSFQVVPTSHILDTINITKGNLGTGYQCYLSPQFISAISRVSDTNLVRGHSRLQAWESL